MQDPSHAADARPRHTCTQGRVVHQHTHLFTLGLIYESGSVSIVYMEYGLYIDVNNLVDITS